MKKNVYKAVSIILTLVMILTTGICLSVCADEAGAELTQLTISSVVNPEKSYHNAGSGTKYEAASPVFDGAYNTYVQWDASTSTNGTTLTIGLKSLSRVRKIDIYVGADGSWNENRRNSRYTSVPVSGVGFSSDSGWGLETTRTSAGNYLNGTGELASAVYATKNIASAITASDLDVISIDIDSVCDEFSLKLSAAGGKYANDSWTDANNTTRMAVAEIVVWGEELTDVLRDDNGEAMCTVETNISSSRYDECEEYLLNDDTGLAAASIKRWRASRPGIEDEPIELVFRLDGVYAISAFRANEYWQSKNQTNTTFSDVDLYIGNTVGATTKWDMIVGGITFNTATAAGHSRNIVCDASGSTCVGDSFKMVINATDYSDEDIYAGYISLTDVGLYGKKTDETMSGTTLGKVDIASDIDGVKCNSVVTTADSIKLTTTYNGTTPTVVMGAAYSINNELIGVAIGNAGEQITINNENEETVYCVKVFGWNDLEEIVPLSTTYKRFATQYVE